MPSIGCLHSESESVKSLSVYYSRLFGSPINSYVHWMRRFYYLILQMRKLSHRRFKWHTQVTPSSNLSTHRKYIHYIYGMRTVQRQNLILGHLCPFLWLKKTKRTSMRFNLGASQTSHSIKDWENKTILVCGRNIRHAPWNPESNGTLGLPSSGSQVPGITQSPLIWTIQAASFGERGQLPPPLTSPPSSFRSNLFPWRLPKLNSPLGTWRMNDLLSLDSHQCPFTFWNRPWG